MANFNKVILAGNLTRDPQLTYLPSQTPVVDFAIAINRYWTGADGQRRDETCYIDVRAYGKQAETINYYMSKGRAILIEGRLRLEQWIGQDGTKRSKHIVIVENFQFLGGPGENNVNHIGASIRPPLRTQQPEKEIPEKTSEELQEPQDEKIEIEDQLPPIEDIPPVENEDDEIPF